MFANFEKRPELYQDKIWIAKWLNLQNLPHWHEEIEIIYCLNGECYIDDEDIKIELKDEQACLIESGKIHSITTSKDSKVITIMIDNNLYKRIANNYKLVSPKLSQGFDIPIFYEKAKKEIKEKEKFYTYIIEGEIMSLLGKIFQKEEIEVINNKTKNNKYELFKDIINEINKNYAKVDFNLMCEKFGYSKSHFSRMFVNLTGTTFSKYLNYVRVENAINMMKLDPNKKISHIAYLCGYANTRSFNRSFFNITGYSPKSLPDNFKLSIKTIKLFDNPYNPTKDNSVEIY